MRTVNENYMSMARTTHNVVLLHERLWGNMQVFAGLSERLDGLLKEVERHLTMAEIITSGYTKDKKVAAEAAVDCAVRLAGIGVSYAVRTKNSTLEEQLHVSRSSLLALSMEAICNKLDDIIFQLQKIVPDLMIYNITEIDIIKLKQLRDNYHNLVDIPRQMTVERKGHNDAANVLVPQIKLLFKEMDPLVTLFNDATFTADYFNARILIEYGSRHTGAAKAGQPKDAPKGN